MQICIHRKDNSPKPVNHCLTLKEGPKVISKIRRLLDQDFVEVGFTLQTSSINNKQVMSTLGFGPETSTTNNKRVISTFKFGYPRLTLKEGPKVKSDHANRFPAHHFLMLVYYSKPL